jgi:hypothetical protein
MRKELVRDDVGILHEEGNKVNDVGCIIIYILVSCWFGATYGPVW